MSNIMYMHRWLNFTQELREKQRLTWAKSEFQDHLSELQRWSVQCGYCQVEEESWRRKPYHISLIGMRLWMDNLCICEIQNYCAMWRTLLSCIRYGNWRVSEWCGCMLSTSLSRQKLKQKYLNNDIGNHQREKEGYSIFPFSL